MIETTIESQILGLAKERLSMMRDYAADDQLEDVRIMYQGLSTLAELAMPMSSALSESTSRALTALESEGTRLLASLTSNNDAE